jgi:hypothetical protein
VVGVVVLVVAGVLAGEAPITHGPLLALALFLLGYGWNLCFVGGSSVLSKELPATEQTQTEGAVDALVWSTSAIASLLSGAILARRVRRARPGGGRRRPGAARRDRPGDVAAGVPALGGATVS